MLRWLKSLKQVFKKEPFSEGSSSYQEDRGMWLFVGLGNPGPKYERNRHNVGFMVVEKIMDSFHDFSPFRAKFQGKVSEGRLGNKKVVLLKPETYMNNSGQSVIKCMQFYKIEPENVIVFHDEIDIDPNTVRVKKGGGTAGHNGLKSIQSHLGTAEFWRVRIGIGRPQHQGDVSDYVLDNFSKAEQEWCTPLVEALSEKSELIVSDSPEGYGESINMPLNKKV